MAHRRRTTDPRVDPLRSGSTYLARVEPVKGKLVRRRTVERIALGLAVVFALYVAAALWPYLAP
jgi:hypothetical protein